MFVFDFKGLPNVNEYVELIKMFLRPSEFAVLSADGPTGHAAAGGGRRLWALPEVMADGAGGVVDKNAVKRDIFDFLRDSVLNPPEWGILTGVRPVKLFGELSRRGGGAEGAETALKRDYYLSDSKISLLREIYLLQRERAPAPEPGTVGVYVGIPFCPTRCEYCSFPSNQVKYDKIAPYLAALEREARFVAAGMAGCGLSAESLYLGGGTPTTLNGRDFAYLLDLLGTLFASPKLREFTVEAGRPDTIDREKLRAMKSHGAGRLSVNPQSMNDAALRRIGRAHSREDVERAFALARDEGVETVNSDVIAGLPEETLEDFRGTMDGILALAPENVTVHALALKRAARLAEQDAEYHYGRGEAARGMMAAARESLAGAGYKPYYLYRQKQMAGNLENVGYARDGRVCLYNVRIMEENQTIVALGAGASTKVFYPEEGRLERIFNVSNYEEYIGRIEEMLDRKRGRLFG
ncbi:MAG: coproporphyrinogen dehydrogenase HemZ [Clostridiales Family XIII bacterium]|jgi:oxygen-independent coproporphyrinogen-3 oxidase|nr:coproporphyrinogen dehydrogenase HemZ [Clostridiales Family XIII bacterium]